MRIRASLIVATLLVVSACASTPPPPPPPPPPPGSIGEAPAPLATKASKGRKHVYVPGGSDCRFCVGDDPAKRQYFDQRRKRYYYFDRVRKAYFWENGEPKI